MTLKSKEISTCENINSEDWKIRLQKNFPFIEQCKCDDDNLPYDKWGFECMGGWYQILLECFDDIVARYEAEGIPLEEIDWKPIQIKEKLGRLRIRYGYKNELCQIKSFEDIVSAENRSIEIEEKSDVDNSKARLRADIRDIVSNAEDKSLCTCEFCGAKGQLRNDTDLGIMWLRTLCDTCHEARIKNADKRNAKKRQD